MDEKTRKFRAMLAAATVQDRRTPEQRARHELALSDIAAGRYERPGDRVRELGGSDDE